MVNGIIRVMPRATRTKKPPPADESTSQTPVESADAPAKSGTSELDWLYELDEGTELAVTRKDPHYAKGYLGTVAHDPNAADGVLERIRAKWGGGTFLLQPKGRQKNGHRFFAGGTARVTIAGAASLDGREYDLDGHLMPREPSREQAPAPPLYPYGFPPQPATPAAGGVVQAQLLSLVERMVNKGGANNELAGVITALSGMQRDPVPTPEPVRVNTMSDMKQMIEMMGLLRQNSVAPAEPADAAPASVDPMERLMQVAAMKFMGGADSPKTAPAGSPGPQPSPNHVWHPARGWLLWKGGDPPVAPIPTDAPPQPTTQPAAAGHDSPPPADEFIQPIQPAEFIGELEAKSPEEQKEFIKSVLGMIESRPDLAAAFMGVANASKEADESVPGGLSAV